MAIDPIIGELKSKGLHPIAYMDDFAIGYNPQKFSAANIIQLMESEVAKYGLQLNREKCRSTEGGQAIRFLGQDFRFNDPIPMHAKLRIKLEHCIEILNFAQISKHQKYLLVRSIVIPRMNYGPLVERCNNHELGKEQYIKLDKMI